MKKMNKKGFTLIELLAVIVILGLLMAIAIPSVTKYITQSRKKTLVSTINNYVSALQTQVNNMEYTFTNANTIYAVPIECIELERGGTDPFGTWHPATSQREQDDMRPIINPYWAYVLVQYDDTTSSYTYGFTFKDSAGYGLEPTSITKLKEKGTQIVTNPNVKVSPGQLGVRDVAFNAENYSDSWNGFKFYKSGTTGCGENGTENCPVTQMHVLFNNEVMNSSCKNVK